MATIVNSDTIYVYPDNYPAYINNGMNIGDMFLHETLHLWYETKGSDGYRPNPLPNDPNFNAHPTVQLNGTDAQGGSSVPITVQFDILDSAGHFNAIQYAAYEHMLIHDDMASGSGDGAWTGLIGAIQGASTVQIGSGAPTKITDGSAARGISDRYSLAKAAMASRGPRRPPTWPDYSAGCALATSSVARSTESTQHRSVVNSSRPTKSSRHASDLNNPIDTYSIDGYALIWDGIPLLPPPPTLTCPPDVYGYCAYQTAWGFVDVPCWASGGSLWSVWTETYTIFGPFGSAQYSVSHGTPVDSGLGDGQCVGQTIWTPGDPYLVYNDMYLP
jgi:hypothetical protein